MPLQPDQVLFPFGSQSLILKFAVCSYRTDSAQQRGEGQEVNRQEQSTEPAGLIVVEKKPPPRFFRVFLILQRRVL